MERYTYEPLPPFHIRLLTISTTENNQLCAAIRPVPFDENNPPTYSALSYVWGTAGFTTPMKCNGNTILYITPTLAEALRNVTTLLRDGESIWVDQICINQQDLEERSQQVGMMTGIYQCASKTLAYLGPPTPSTALAIDLIRRVGTVARNMAGDIFLQDREERNRGLAFLMTKEEISIEESEKLGIPFDDIASWDAFTEFYDRPWYERIWIVQEMLPSRSGFVIVGTFSVSWDFVKGAALWHFFKAGAVPKRHKPSVRGIELTANMDLPWDWRVGVECVKELSGRRAAPIFRWELARLLAMFRRRKATDPKDKVYALLGLSEFDLGMGDLKVDYAKDVKTIFTDTARAIIKGDSDRHKPNLDIILQARRTTCKCEVDAEPQAGEWPSWVPDWRQHSGTGCTWGIGEDFKEWHDERNAGKHIEELSDIASNPFVLVTRGVVLGRVVYVSPYRHFSEMALQGRMREARDEFMGMVSSYPNGQEVDIAFAMTMMGGVLPKSIVDRGHTDRWYADNYLNCIDILSMPNSTPEEDQLRDAKVMQYWMLGFEYDWYQIAQNAYCERRWYVLDTGHVGLGNYRMQQGDIVAKLVGLSMPCVLRPLGDGESYQFIGEAYCHGEMAGLDRGVSPGVEVTAERPLEKIMIV
ncbi:hypothetical protein N0V85_007176 [Neurospora sp. IMI 360204]|nr:hypothetical protein N0V85_007176 [Neurospora sp. IMI 360204]